jgi:deoxyribose-phosphate aldolase
MGWADSVAASTKRSGQAQGFITIGLYEFYDGFGLMRWVTSEDVPRSGELRVPAGAIFTPSARELAEARAIRIIELRADQAAPAAPPEKIVALGADHGGFHLKEALKPVLAGLGLETRDVGVFDEKPADYPDIAQKVAELVARGEARRGVIIDGAGIGSSIAANKVSGIRAALCYDRASARNSREHNDSNVLTLGARLLTGGQAEEVLRTWLETPFAGGRHTARVEKIARIEREYSRVPQPLPDGMPSGPGSVAVAEPGPEGTPSASGVASLIDHTMLRPEATRGDIVKLCGEARQYGFATVCINPYWVPLAASELAGTTVKVCTVAGFPLGATSTEAKVAESAAALRAGAREIDMVINIGALRSGDFDAVKLDIQAVTRVCHDAAAIVKVILETALLDDAQKTAACGLAQAAGADFVKTSTGFGPAGATVQDIVLMRHAVGPRMGVKAAGGIRTLDDFRAMVAAGANRVGASASVKIVEAAGK